MQTILQKINEPQDIKNLSKTELVLLAEEIREFILDVLAIKEGHLGANLGVVELTIALHYHYNTPYDLVVWDVGHQTYAHKILTGRKDLFHTLREINGISGFPSINESEYDTFGTGHSSTSISAILGMAKADAILKNNRKHIAIIGDASIASGMAFEALNHLGDTDLDVLVILNDNSIGIDPSIGALKNHLKQLYSQNNSNIFKDLNLYYKGVVDGHNINDLLNSFTELDKINKPKLLHINTKKGKGYEKAEIDQVTWHAPGKFLKETGTRLKEENAKSSYSTIFGEALVELADLNPKIFAVTPAMPTGSNLYPMMEKYPERIVDVGIAEQHAVTFSAGIATRGLIPYCVIYSTFLQRAYDQIIHDVAIQNLNVVFCVDRAGIVGKDGVTHHGYFDISFLSSIPNFIVAVPKDATQLRNLLYTAQLKEYGPFAIRYPRGKASNRTNATAPFSELAIGKGIEEKKGNTLAILFVGEIGNKINAILEELNKATIGLYNMVYVKPLDANLLDQILENYSTILTFEDGILNGGFGSQILHYANKKEYKGKIKIHGYPDAFITHGNTNDLYSLIGLSQKHIKEIILDCL